MSQQPGRPCPTCNTLVPQGQRFCSNCGTDLSVSSPSSQYGGTSPQNYPQSYPPSQPVRPVPPYAQAPYGQYQQPPQPQKSSPVAEAFGVLGLLFLLRRYRPGYMPRRQSSGCCGCLVSLFILFIILGIPTYVVYRNNPHIFQQVQQNLNTGNSGNSGNGSTTQPSVTTASINQTVNYASVDITIVSVQQATAFADDNDTAASGMIRVNIKEVNNSGHNASYFYSDMAHLILPDKSSVTPTNEQQSSPPANSTERNNWLDFPVPTSDRINQLTLLLGTDQEAQISIPLTGNANLSAFQPQTTNPNTPINYGGLNWTLKTATGVLSAGGKQATTGMRYVVLTFNVDNPTSGNVNIGFPDEYMRLKAGGVTNASSDTTLPITIDANTSGITGTVTFLMPGGGTTFTLELLVSQGGADPSSTVQVNTDFQI
jgi:hypothetical protein